MTARMRCRAFVTGAEMVENGRRPRCVNTEAATHPTLLPKGGLVSMMPPDSDRKIDPTPLSWDDLCDLPTTIDLLGDVRPRMRDVWLAGVPAVVVPTRMHEPGWYIRNGDQSSLDRYWLLRSETDYELIRQLCAAGAVTSRG